MSNADWKGNSHSTFVTLGARTYAKNDREQHDYYATEPKAAILLMKSEQLSSQIWECACGEGHLAKEFEKAGYTVYASDIVNRGYGYKKDFLKSTKLPHKEVDIITNPPYSKAEEFIRHGIELVGDGHKVIMFLKIQFLEGKTRRKLFDTYKPKVIHVSTSRIKCAINGEFDKYAKAPAICYAWYVWEKGYNGDTIIKWMN